MANRGSYTFNAKEESVKEAYYEVNPQEALPYETYVRTKKEEVIRPNNNAETCSGNTSGNTKFAIILTGLMVLMIFLLVILIAMTAYNITLTQNDTSCTCKCDTATSTSESSHTNEALTSALTGTQNLTQDIYQLLSSQLINNDTASVLQLLQEVRYEQMACALESNNSEVVSLIEQHSQESLLKLTEIISTLANHKDTSISTAAVIDDILIIVKDVLKLQNTTSLLDSLTPVSCQDILTESPNSPSGYYHVNSGNIYCDMSELCGSAGGWTRVAYLDMTDATESCPEELNLYQSGGVRACGRSNVGPNCSPSVKFVTNGIKYTEICGRMIGYQYGSTDAVGDTSLINITHHNDLNSYYVDGVGLTRGSPREHVWTFMAGLFDSAYSHHNCPCNTPPGTSIQSFVGSHYFCEAGCPSNPQLQVILYSSDPLWDGEGCGSQEANCCAAEGLPWFYRTYNESSSDYLEMRICSDEDGEDSPVSFYEIYVK